MISEIIAALVVIYGLYSGWKNGLVKELCSTCGFIVGLILAWYFHDDIAGGGVLGFLVVMIGTPIVLGFLASLLSGIISCVPVVGSLNRLGGAVIGCLKYSFLMGCILLLDERWGLNIF